MTFINWDGVDFEVEQTWGLAQFTDLIRKVNRQAYQKARASLDEGARADIDSLMGLRPEAPIDAKESLVCLIKALPTRLGFSAHRPNIDGPTRHLFIWCGNRTAHRAITLRVYRNGTCAVTLSTGTGKPSRFLEPWCRRVIRMMLTDIEAAAKYYD